MLTRHNVTAFLLVLLILTSLVGIGSSLLLPTDTSMYTVAIRAIGLLIFGGLLAAHLNRWPWADTALVVSLVILTICAFDTALLRDTVVIGLFLPVVVSALLSTPITTIVVSVTLLIGIVLRVWVQYGYVDSELLGPIFQWQNLLSASVITVGVILISAVSQHTARIAQAKADEAQAALRQVEQQAHTLTEQNRQLEERSGEQQRLLELVATLETPALTLAEGVLFAPIVGHVDSHRAQNLTDRLLDDAHTRRAKVVVIDVSGIVVMDTGVASALLQTARALRLLGCQVVLSGISATVAITLTQLGIELSGVQTTRTPQEALQLAVQLQNSGAARPAR